MSLFLLDTNACIQHLTGRSSLLEANMMAVGDASIVMCAVVAGEFGRVKGLQVVDWQTAAPRSDAAP
jgi:predicted nucleic acid-binding protein